MTVKVDSMTVANAPRQQVTDMLAGGSDEDFEQSLPDSIEPPSVDETRVRKTRKPRGPNKKTTQPVQGEIVDERLERAKRKFASLGGGSAVKGLCNMIDKPLDNSEEEDVDDYFYLLSRKAKLDPSESWVVMISCMFILVFRLLGTRTSIGTELKKLFEGKKEEKEEVQDAE